MKFETHAKGLAQLRDKDARALYPVLAGSAALALAVVAVFTIDSLLARFVESKTGLVLLGLLVASQFLSAAFATSKLQELVWWREYSDNTVGYLRTLPVPKRRLWLAKVQITAVGGIIILALLTVSVVYGVPYAANVFGPDQRVWGVAWITHMMSNPVVSFAGPFFVYGLAGMALLSFAYTCAPVGARRWRQREPIWLSIAGRPFAAHRVNAWLVIAIGVTTLGFSLARWPIAIPASFLVASLIVWYLSSYLAFSAANLSMTAARRWMVIAASASIAVAALSTTVSAHLSGAQSVTHRMIGYALARPLGTERYTNRFLEHLRGPQQDIHALVETSLATYLLDRDTIVALQPRLESSLADSMHCTQRALALALLSIGAARDNAHAPQLLDANGAPRADLQGVDCAVPASDFADLLLHFSDEARALDRARHFLAAPDLHTRLIGVELAARLPAIEPAAAHGLKRLVLESLPAICASRTDPDLRANYVRSHLNALSQLTLHQNLTDPGDLRRALDTDCAQAVAEVLAAWRPIVTSQEDMRWDFKSAFARDFEFATGARFDFNLTDVTPESFAAWLRRDVDWEKIDAPMRCYLARQWHLAHRVPPLLAARHLLKAPTGSSVLGISVGRSLFSERDCA